MEQCQVGVCPERLVTCGAVISATPVQPTLTRCTVFVCGHEHGVAQRLFNHFAKPHFDGLLLLLLVGRCTVHFAQFVWSHSKVAQRFEIVFPIPVDNLHVLLVLAHGNVARQKGTRGHGHLQFNLGDLVKQPLEQTGHGAEQVAWQNGRARAQLTQ